LEVDLEQERLAGSALKWSSSSQKKWLIIQND
jgi:hypothetical protein